MDKSKQLLVWLVYTVVHMLVGLWAVTDTATRAWLDTNLHPFIIALALIWWFAYGMCAPMLGATITEERPI